MNIRSILLSTLLSMPLAVAHAETVSIHCPPASALHHSRGLAWTLEEPYASEGWAVMNISKWSYLSAIPKHNSLKVAISEEFGDAKNGHAASHLAATCDYSSESSQDEVLVKSLFEVAVTPDKLTNFTKNPNIPSELICKTTADKSENCTWPAYNENEEPPQNKTH
jgi:hypothetical protein